MKDSEMDKKVKDVVQEEIEEEKPEFVSGGW